MKRHAAILLMLACILGLLACAKQNDDALSSGVNATIHEIDISRKQITVSGTDEGSFLGENCVISCDNIPMLYCNYKSGMVNQISIQDLQIDDEIILGVKESEISQFIADKGVLSIEQLQLGTQRLN